MTSTTKPFAAILSTSSEASFMSALWRELPELKGVSCERLQAALSKAMAYAIAENGPSFLSVVKTEDSFNGRTINVSEPQHCVAGGNSREDQTARDLDVRFQVKTSLKHYTAVEQSLRIDLHTMQSTKGIPLFELRTMLGYVVTPIQTGEGLHRLEISSLMQVVNGLKELNEEAHLADMATFEDLEVYTGPNIESFFGSDMHHMEVVGFLRQLGRTMEEQPGGQFPAIDKCAGAVALYQLACVLEMFPDYLQECYNLLD